MLKKRLVGVITVKDGRAVQSFGYSRYLPLGRPEVLAENLDRWGADEILLQCIDRSVRGLGPDLELLQRVAAAGLSTPLIYGGGIRSVDDAVAAVRAGADRVCIDALLHRDMAVAAELGGRLGAQAIIAALPLSSPAEWFDYRTRRNRAFSRELLDLLKSGAVSEALMTDHQHEGRERGFDFDLANVDLGLPLIVFGGISEPEQIASLLQRDNVVAVAVGNFLNYREHALQALRAAVEGAPLRAPIYERPLAIL